MSLRMFRLIAIGSSYICESEMLGSDYRTGNRGLIHKKCFEDFQCELCRKEIVSSKSNQSE